MSHDTSKDPRLLVAEIALRRLLKLLPLRQGIKPKLSKQQTNELLKQIESSLMTCKFMYLEPSVLAGQEQLLTVVDSARKLHESVADLFDKQGFSPAIKAELRWCFQVLEGLPPRLEREGRTMAAGVDLMAVKVLNVMQRDKLWITRVSNGSRELTVVTNMPGVEAGQVLGAAFLPPAQLAGTTSEAMFLGKEVRTEPPGTYLGEGEVDARDASSCLHEELP
jgi:predicted RNA-binding protein with EMAP domain